MPVDLMTEEKQFSPLKVGILIVAMTYFLFALHSVFELQWVGEWNRLATTSSMRFDIYIEDVTAFVGMIFRFVGSIIAVTAILFYFSKNLLPSRQRTFKILRWVLVFEGIYWLGLLTTAIIGDQLTFAGSGSASLMSVLNTFVLSDLPVLVESIVLPIALFILASTLNPNKPDSKVIRWSLITGAVYVVVFWLLNATMWIITLQSKGNAYLTSYPANLVSFIMTEIGLPALAIYAIYFALKFTSAETWQELNLKAAGAMITALGTYYLWNFLTWVFFAPPWSEWYAWFLGHNLDLWILSLPLLGLPLLFNDQLQKNSVKSKLLTG
jgi:hypothetical protein